MRTCEYVIEGRPDGPTVVFIHGWPDDASLWRNQLPALGRDFRCVLVTLPNFGRRSMKVGGFDFPELIEMLAATIRVVQPEGKVHLVTHDWGTYMGYSLEKAHPDLVDRMVALDVGGHLSPSPKAALMIAGYQWALVAAWLVGGVVPPLGDMLSRGVGKVVRVPRPRRREIRSRFNYSYFYLWRAMLLPWKRSSLLGRYRPRCPLLYLYGEKKPLMFHSQKWLRIVEDAGGQWEGLMDAGHWLMETHPEYVNGRIADWLKS